ncbi:MAG: photosystem I assembly protein Ycf3 [Syntrophorhabdus sp. PtaU1.Bin153]|nr:MAG: photosystem I assembly protein Ycf3 [Syntrophorhabdus sp. PtaU1.Bin153]
MSVILDALKKAQEERKSSTEASPYDRKGGGPQPRWPFYAMAVVAACALLALVLVPGIYRSGRAPSAKVAQSLPAAKKDSISGEPGNTVKPETVKEHEPDQQKQGAQSRSATQPHEEARSNRPDLFEPVKARKSTFALVRPGLTVKDTPPPEQPFSRQESKRGSRPGATMIDHDKVTRLYNEAVKETARGNVSHAKQLYHTVLAEWPAHTEALNNLGVNALREGSTKEALFYFNKILQYRKDYGKVYNNMGLALMKDGQKKSAEEYFRRSIEIEKNALEPALNLAALLRADKRYEEAGRLLEGFLGSGTKDRSLYLSYGLIKDEMGQREEAIMYYKHYLREGGGGAERNEVAERLRVLEKTRPSQDH